jgi:uncharacterized membrane protein
MSTVDWIVIAVVVFLALLIAGGLAGNARLRRAQRRQMARTLREANEALATARASDRGWDRAMLEAAAREAFAMRSTEPISELMLIQVEDNPGVDEDRCVVRVVTEKGSEDLRLSRRGGSWAAD